MSGQQVLQSLKGKENRLRLPRWDQRRSTSLLRVSRTAQYSSRMKIKHLKRAPTYHLHGPREIIASSKHFGTRFSIAQLQPAVPGGDENERVPEFLVRLVAVGNLPPSPLISGPCAATERKASRNCNDLPIDRLPQGIPGVDWQEDDRDADPARAKVVLQKTAGTVEKPCCDEEG